MQVHSQAMQKMRVGNTKLICHSWWKKIVQAASSAREANEWKGERSANNLPWIQIKVSVLLLTIWAAEMLLWVLIRKRKILKEMWAACPWYIFRSQPHLVKPVTEMMLANWRSLAKSWGRWIAVSRGLCQGCPAIQFTSRECVQPATPASSQYHGEPISLFSQAITSPSVILIFVTSVGADLGSHLTSSLAKEVQTRCYQVLATPSPQEEGNASLSFAWAHYQGKQTQLISQPVCLDIDFKHFQDLIPVGA